MISWEINWKLIDLPLFGDNSTLFVRREFKQVSLWHRGYTVTKRVLFWNSTIVDDLKLICLNRFDWSPFGYVFAALSHPARRLAGKCSQLLQERMLQSFVVFIFRLFIRSIKSAYELKEKLSFSSKNRPTTLTRAAWIVERQKIVARPSRWRPMWNVWKAW